MRNGIILMLFQLPFVSILLWMNVMLATGQCLEDQKRLLLQLRNNLTFDSSFSSKLVHWNGSSDCCQWPGLNCDKSGHVIGLDLSSESISAGINDSSSLFGLNYLQKLNIAANNFDAAELPSRFDKLAQLTHLNLSNSGFGGQIPEGFSLLTRLVILDLSSSLNFLQIENPNLHMLVKNLSKLREVYLDGANISTEGFDWSQALSSSLPDLNVLSLSNCDLSDLPSSFLLKLRSLSVIHLDGNPFSGHFPEFFADLSNLTVLTIGSCDLSGMVPQELFQVPTLRTIDLSNNRDLEGSLPKILPKGSLQNLMLGYTKISGSLPDSISNLTSLSQLDIRACNFSGPIPSSMSKLTHLVYLDLSVNQLSGTIPSFRQSKNLSILNCYNNNFSGEMPSSLWEGLNSLTFLDLGENSFSGPIPASLFSLPSLKVLQLSGNQFSGNIGELKDGSSSGLESLDLSRNNLEGLIPQFLFQFHNLTSLLLSHNKLTGIVNLTFFSTLEYLSALDLSFNNLSVVVSGPEAASTRLPQFGSLMLASCKLQTIPPLRNQSRMMMLDLSSNQLTGEIPNWVWDIGDGMLRFLNLSHNSFTRLQEPYRFRYLDLLDLHSNLLEGELLLPPGAAAYVDFSSNKFGSSIPKDVGKYLSRAIYFSIANNRITGSIPFSLCNATHIHVLDLSNNSLLGTIPSCLLAGSYDLGVLDLGRNNLSGNIPAISLERCGLETLDLSWNQLEGQVPESLANCTKLKVLNLGNNKMADAFPCWLTKLSNLRIIVLRVNRFRGSISCITNNNTWPNLQIIDVALNNFSGGLPLQSSSNLKAMIRNENEASKLDHLSFSSLSNEVYYQDSATIVLKGQEIVLEKILTAFTSIDFSSNNFEGAIPNTIGELKSLYLLNLSHNVLTSHIPPSIGNLQQLGSLDFSFNRLDGEIPKEIGSLTFLSFLNLSYNHLSGKIPEGSQIQTFPASSFIGNEGLCGFPLNKTCNADDEAKPPEEAEEANQEIGVFVCAALVFGVGLGIIFAPFYYSRRWNNYYNRNIDLLVSKILHQKYQTGRTRFGYGRITLEKV